MACSKEAAYPVDVGSHVSCVFLLPRGKLQNVPTLMRGCVAAKAPKRGDWIVNWDNGTTTQIETAGLKVYKTASKAYVLKRRAAKKAAETPSDEATMALALQKENTVAKALAKKKENALAQAAAQEAAAALVAQEAAAAVVAQEAAAAVLAQEAAEAALAQEAADAAAASPICRSHAKKRFVRKEAKSVLESRRWERQQQRRGKTADPRETSCKRKAMLIKALPRR